MWSGAYPKKKWASLVAGIHTVRKSGQGALGLSLTHMGPLKCVPSCPAVSPQVVSGAVVVLTFPLILPGILAAALLSFALSLDDFIITLFNAGSLVTFPLYINGSFRVKFPPEVNVLATVILIVSIALMLTGTLWGARGRRKSAA